MKDLKMNLKKILSSFMVFVMITTLIPQMSFASNDLTDEDYITADQIPVGSKVVLPIKNDDGEIVDTTFLMVDNQKTNMDTDGALLLLNDDTLFIESYYQLNALCATEYQGSDLQEECVNIYTQRIPDVLKNALIKTTKEDAEWDTGLDEKKESKSIRTKASELKDEYIFPLSAQELANVDETNRYYGGDGQSSFWTRSPEVYDPDSDPEWDEDKLAVKWDGTGFQTYRSDDGSFYVRFAMNLDKSCLYQKKGDIYRFVVGKDPKKVRFLDGKGNVLLEEYVANGDAATPPADPSMPHYQFDKWDKPFDKITEDIDITGIYTPLKYTVKYDTDGGTKIDDKTDAEWDKDHLLPKTDPTKAGYSFGGWYSAPSKQPQEEVTNDTKFGDIANEEDTEITLYAKFTMNSDYVVHYDAGEHAQTPQTERSGFAWDQTNILPTEEPTYNAHEIVGWYTTSDFQEESQVTDTTSFGDAAGQKEPDNKTITLYAKWDWAKVKVTFNAGEGAKNVPQPQFTYINHSAKRPEDPTLDRHYFVDWYDNEQYEGSPFDFNTPLSEDITLYAKWELCTDLKDSEISFVDTDTYTYTGNKINPKIQVKLGETTLTEQDYKIEYVDNTNVGTATVKIIGLGKYCGENSKNFNIVARNINGVTVKHSTSAVYTGKKIIPNVTVTYNGKKIGNENYKITCSSNTNIGTAKITIEGKKNLKGSITSTFKIVLGNVTEFKISKTSCTSAVLTWKRGTVSTGYLIYLNGKLNKTITSPATLKATVSKLKAGKVYKFQIATYKTINGKKYYSGKCKSIIGITTPARVVISKLTTKAKSITATWGAKTCTRYEVQLATDSNFKKNLTKAIVSAKVKSKTFKSLKKGTRYYVRVRAVTNSGEKVKYGSWSKVASVICK